MATSTSLPSAAAPRASKLLIGLLVVASLAALAGGGYALSRSSLFAHEAPAAAAPKTAPKPIFVTLEPLTVNVQSEGRSRFLHIGMALKVNDELMLSGRFRVFDDWPVDVMGRPDTVYVNTGVPGPVFVRKESFLNGVNMANSTSLAIGGDYEFRVKLRARAPGTYHVHPLINVYNGGPIQGPGKWVTVEAGDAPFNRADVVWMSWRTVCSISSKSYDST